MLVACNGLVQLDGVGVVGDEGVIEGEDGGILEFGGCF